MHLVLLSGGSGKRLWPLSNDIRSKQFIKLFKDENGEYISMVQRIYRQIESVDPDADITITTSKTQVSAIGNQLGKNVDVCVEPCRRDTFPAIALATAYLHDVKGVSKDEPIAVCPVDPYVDPEYFTTIFEMIEHAKTKQGGLTLMGIEPDYPSEKFGYIIPKAKEHISAVSEFKEKPDRKTAEKYLEQGALWNGGVFVFKVGYILDIAKKLFFYTSYSDILAHFEDLEKISFDYAVVEHEKDIDVIRYTGMWNDLGTWSSLTEEIEDTAIGNAIIDKSCKNTHVLNELNIPVVCMGLEDTIVSASPDGILVSKKDISENIKKHVDALEGAIMYAEKSWGSYTVMDIQSECMTVKVTLNPGHGMNYHSHQFRDEVWTITSGRGYAVIDDKVINVNAGDVISIKRGTKHTIFANSELNIIEVQMGRDINVSDKIKYELKTFNAI